MMHPHTELRFISNEIGYGVVATQFIPKGTITWVKDKLDRDFEPTEISKMDDLYQNILEKYCYRDNRGRYVLCWDIARFVNHSFNSSCLSTAYDFEFAVKDIHPGEELTDDYGYLNVSEPFDCMPEAGTNRTRVFPDDLLRYHHQWDQQLQQTFPLMLKVQQPLLSIMDPNIITKAQAIAQGAMEMDSILNCYYDEKKYAAIRQNGSLR